MSRPLRLEYPGSLWHITSRGNEKRDIFADDHDRHRFLDFLGESVNRFDWILPAYVLMTNHYHAVIQLTASTLSRGMHWLNGRYVQGFNRRHGRVGHLCQGRFKGKLIDKENYYLEVLRYVILNPVRAGMVERPEDYAWSSYRATVGEEPAPKWLAVDDVLTQFGPERQIALDHYRRFVHDGIGSERRLWDELVGQMYLGGEAWIEKVREQVALKPRADEHPRSQRLIGEPKMIDIVAAVARTWSTDADRIRHTRGGVLRMVAAWVGWHERLTSRDIAAGLRLRSSGYVSTLVQRCDRELASNSVLRDGVDRCLATLGRKK